MMAVSYIVAAFSLYSTFFITRTDGQCQVGNKTYQVGEVWTSDECSEILSCLENSTYATIKCQNENVTEVLRSLELNETEGSAVVPPCCIITLPTSADTEVSEGSEANGTDELTANDLTIMDLDITTMFSYKNETGCIENNKTFMIGETYYIPGKCFSNLCEGENIWIRKGCPLLVAPEGWKLTPMDTSKSYPECCEGIVPDLDIVPDILDKMPYVEFLSVTYENNVTVDKGRELTPTQVKSEPTIAFTADPSAWYTLVMVDPDAPSRKDPTLREILHWMVVNIPGNNVSAGEVVSGYRGSGAPQGTGLHRYVFFVYKQPDKLTFDEPRVSSTSRKNRLNFSLKKFSQKYNLGDPVAFNAFQAQWDEYVPILQQLTDPE